MWPLIVLNDRDRLTLQVALSQLHAAHGTDYGMLMMIAVVPMVLCVLPRGEAVDRRDHRRCCQMKLEGDRSPA